jgi:hypothetical protein
MSARARAIGARSLAAVVVAGMLSLALAGDAHAQLKGHYIPGFTGLQNGTQTPPGISLALPVYFYTTDDIRDGSGRSIGIRPRITSTFTGPVLAWVTNVKVLGANLGGAVVPIAFIKTRIETDTLGKPGSFAFTDIELQPLQLGWHVSRADIVTGYALFMPTGRWKLGGDDNSGLGMWSHLLQLGSTLHLDDKHAWTFSALGTYELHSHKKNTGLRTGDIITVEGGLGKSLYRISAAGGTPVPSRITNVGLVYYGQFKVTADRAGALTPVLGKSKDRVFGAGIEGNVIFPKSGVVLGLRAAPEFGTRTRTQGWTILFTAAYELESLVKTAEPSASAAR